MMGHSDTRLMIAVLGGAVLVVLGAWWMNATGPVYAQAPGSPIQSGPPVLTGMTPSTGPEGEAYPLQVTLTGSGFSREGNTIKFGPATTTGLPSADGQTLTFSVPKIVQMRSEVPPMVLQAGAYDVTVTTSAGISNSLQFMLTR